MREHRGPQVGYQAQQDEGDGRRRDPPHQIRVFGFHKKFFVACHCGRGFLRSRVISCVPTRAMAVQNTGELNAVNQDTT